MRKNGINRLAAFMAAVIFGTTSFAVPKAANGYEDTAVPADYKADAAKINKNLVPNVPEQNGFKYLCVNNQYEVTYDTLDSDQTLDGVCRWYLREGTGMLSMSDNDKYKGFAGFSLNQARGGTGDGSFGFVAENGKTYVISAKVKNVSSDGIIPHFGAAMNNSWVESAAVYTNEYGKEGMALESDDWMPFRATVTIPDDYENTNSYRNNVYFGFPDLTVEGASFYIDVRDKDSFYFAEEQPFDIKLSADGSMAVNRTSVRLEAQLVNQIGLKGGLLQEFNWYAFTGDGSAEEPGITFDGNGASVTASWDESIARGEYIIAAKSKTYDEFVRTTRIMITDEIPEEKTGAVPENLIPDATAENGYKYLCIQSHASVTYDNEQTVDGRAGYSTVWYLREGAGKLSMSGSEYMGFAGFTLNQARNGVGAGSFGFVAENGKTYVISANLKNASTNGSTPRFGAAMNNSWGEDTIVYTNEYGKKGMAVDSEDWMPFRATITIPRDFSNSNSYRNNIYCGFPDKTTEGTRFYIDTSNNDSVYFAEEVPWRIKLSYEKTDTLSEGDVIDIRAEVVNQADIKGTLNQDIGWYCVSRDGSRALDGFDIEPYDGGAKITVKSAENINDLKIMAVSSKYDLVSGAYPVNEAEPASLFVAEDGADNSAGTQSEPLATLKGARDRVRNMRENGFNGEIEVIFGGGRYYFDKSVSFDENDLSEAKTVYKAAPGEKVVFTGGIRLDSSQMQKVTDSAVLNRVKENVRDNLYEINLAEQGFPYSLTEDDAAQPTISELFGWIEYPALYADGNEQQLAQWPNGHGSYATYGYVSADTLSYTDDEPSSWTNAEDWWVGGYLSRDFDYTRTPAVSVDAQAKTVTVSIREDAGISIKENPSASIKKSWRWKAFNLLEELDMPTEWYIDKATMKLYYCMPDSLKNASFEISALKTAIISITDNENISFEGITFESTRGTAIEACGVKNVSVKNCGFNNIGTHAINIFGTKKAETDKNYWQRQNINAAYDCRIEDSRFDNIGGSAIILEGGNVDTLEKGNNIIENNLFFKCSQKIKAREAILVKGCGNSVLHNNISRTDFQAIRYYGNDHLIKYNEIHDVIQETDDCGAVYGGRNTLQRGTEIAYNYIHDIKGTYTPSFAHKPAIYWDDNQTGIYAHHNIINNAYINVYTNGIDNRYEYNTSVNIEKTNLDFKNGGAASNSNADPEPDVFSSNIADPELYYAAYPNLKTIVESSSRTARTLAGLTIIKGNVCVNGPGANGGSSDGIESYTKKPVKYYFTWKEGNNISDNHDNLTTEQAPFVDAANQDFRFKGYANPDLNNPYEGSFDINLIGVQSENTPAASGFTAVYPCGEKVAPGYVRFIWNDAFEATKYKVTVASDSEFKNIIAESESYYNYADINIPQSTETLYWKVMAYNTSRQFNAAWESEVYTFSNGARVVATAEINSDKTISTHIINNYYDENTLQEFMVQYEDDGVVAGIERKAVVGAKGVEETVSFSQPSDKAKSVILMVVNNMYIPVTKAIGIRG